MDKFQNKYRIPSARLRNWDYGWNAPYFITICTQHRQHYFGHIVEMQNTVSSYKMQLSEIGCIANTCWHEIPQHFPFVQLGPFVVMPNHVHGIIIINKPNDERYVETQNFASLQQQQQQQSPSKNKFGPQSKNLASIIRGFKIGVTKNARNIHAEFAWQPRFHDHIIRDDNSYQRISQYIYTNPDNWTKDKFNP